MKIKLKKICSQNNETISKTKINGFRVDVWNKIENDHLLRVYKKIFDMSEIDDEPFYLFNIGDVYYKLKLWKELFPRVKPFYAVKCNPNPLLLAILNQYGCGFDCASVSEIDLVLQLPGITPERIIFAHPYKFLSHLVYAKDKMIKRMTFDSELELYKIYELFPEAEVVLRVFIETNKARCPLGLKFGAPISTIENLILTCIKLNLNLVGVSFHVGSGCFDSNVYSEAIEISYSVFEVAKKHGIHMKLLDIGGGFPGDLDTEENVGLLYSAAKAINELTDKYFPDSDNFELIAEPGRYFIASSMTLCCTVIDSHPSNYLTNPPPLVWTYYINDSINGSFNCIIFDHYLGEYYLLRKDKFRPGHSDKKLNELFNVTLLGPTGRSCDEIIKNIKLPKPNIGDMVIFRNMGAYTYAAGTEFSCLKMPKVFNIVLESELNHFDSPDPFFKV